MLRASTFVSSWCDLPLVSFTVSEWLIGLRASTVFSVLVTGAMAASFVVRLSTGAIESDMLSGRLPANDQQREEVMKSQNNGEALKMPNPLNSPGKRLYIDFQAMTVE